MAGTVNKVMLLGRLVADPETRTFQNGGSVCFFRFVVDGSDRKNQQTGKWESEPCWLDVKAFNPADKGRKLGEVIQQYCHKGSRLHVEGHLITESWEDKNGGGKRSRLVIVCDQVTLVGGKADDGPSGGAPQAPKAPQAPRRPTQAHYDAAADPNADEGFGGPGDADSIPF